jgi:membrane protein implicated in regulation of membrane protease activity
MAGWMWIALGLVLAAIELATPGGFFIIFFGVGAVAVGLLRLVGLLEPAWAQWLAFPIVALVALRFFRQPLLARLQGRDSGHVVDTLVGDTALPSNALEAGGRGKAEVRGAVWNARNVGERAVGARERCRVVAVNGLELDIRPE